MLFWAWRDLPSGLDSDPLGSLMNTYTGMEIQRDYTLYYTRHDIVLLSTEMGIKVRGIIIIYFHIRTYNIIVNNKTVVYHDI